MKPLWIIKAGTTFPQTARRYADFDQWTREALCTDPLEVRTFDVESDRLLPAPEACGGVVITGSHAMVTDRLPWSVQLEQWIPHLLEAGVPVLGICYGHQLLAQALGGRVDYHPQGREVGTVEVTLLPDCQEDPLFHSFPESISAHVVHAQTVVELPPRAILLARNAFEPHHAFRVGSTAWGVQFHPEYSAAIMRSYMEHLTSELAASHRDVSALMAAVEETPSARQVTQRFARLVRNGR